jgi:dsRNA-specific ribonuclease
VNLEEILKVWQFIKDNELTNNKTHDEKIFIEKNYAFLQWAFTFNEDVQDFNYETLETLGDSILKMLATTLVYHINELNDKETNVDKLVFGRKTLICNLHLFNKGKKSKIYNYIIKYPKEITNYFFPLEHENIKSEKIKNDPSEISFPREHTF